ncbi:glycosyl hydrolase family 95 catalytic domain-containing protein [Paenibacillus lemnae]|uniref:Glycoside hydrolase family 95 protein n=1 Tax=Paenibacillus lemnae TaxID=1330551 RepID=A0A848M4J5_PAELE|nr:glycoside hydrolase N-terminal domain-containing protein [Paenibacillus lemnae]NMO95032.1 glycoside hydrolase family 95 protein [Paenibacillus lemnae]
MRLESPASWWKNMWREALPSGNGEIGASVFGGVQQETILLNHADLWHWGRRDPLPDVSDTLEQTRRHMDEGNYMEASWTLANALKESGYASALASRFPVAAIQLNMPQQEAFTRYERALEMSTGEVSVSWNDGVTRWTRDLFVSRADDCVVYRIHGDRPEACLDGGITLQLHPSDRWQDDPRYKELQESVSVMIQPSVVCYAGRNDDGLDFGAVMQLIPEGGQIIQEGDQLKFQGAHSITAVVRVFAGAHDREAEWNKLKKELAGRTLSYDQLLERHVSLHRPLFESASFTLGDGIRSDAHVSNERLLLDAYQGEAPEELVQRMWAYGRYLFISGTGRKDQPFGLYGLWGGDYRLVWCHNMANENIQMMYWHAHVGGLGELTGSLYRYYGGLMDDFRNNALKLYGCQGIYIPAGTTPGSGVPNQIVPVILNWTGAAAWLASHYYKHYCFTGDETFLKETAWPFMREALRFYEDFLTIEHESGQIKIYPSVSPENTPLNFMPPDGVQLAHPMPTAVNSTMDIALMKELLSSMLEAADVVDCEPGEVERWEELLKALPPYTVNGDGAVREWLDETFADRYEHRHLSHLYPMFPGQEVEREEQPELFAAFEAAVRLRKLGAQSGWSLAHMASVYARLGDGNRALDCLGHLSRSCLLPNLFTLHNDWRGMGICMDMPTAPVQLDAALGWVNAVQEMLLYVSPGLVKLLPALPSGWKSGQVKRWRFCTGHLSMEWDRERHFFKAELHAERDTDIALQLPAGVTTGGSTLENGTPLFAKASVDTESTFNKENSFNEELSFHVDGERIAPNAEAYGRYRVRLVTGAVMTVEQRWA